MGASPQSSITTLEQCFDFPATIERERRLQSLWAGYGDIVELSVRDKSSNKLRTYIVKKVQPPAGSGVSHERKLHSYQVEAYFYQVLATDALRAACPMPLPLRVESDLGKAGGALTLLMNDLRQEFTEATRGNGLDLAHARAGLEWLAAFHAHFWEQPRPEGVWPQGSFWYLDTRLEELECTDSEWRALKDIAFKVDAALKGQHPDGSRDRRHRTLVHGDFKAANLMWSHSQDLRCAAYDFQYIGEGYGMRDVAYFMTSAVSSRIVAQHEEQLLRHYHTQLTRRLSPEQAAAYTLEVAVGHFELCLLDFVRFMAGWGFWGNDSWAARKARAIMQSRFGV